MICAVWSLSLAPCLLSPPVPSLSHTLSLPAASPSFSVSLFRPSSPVCASVCLCVCVSLSADQDHGSQLSMYREHCCRISQLLLLTVVQLPGCLPSCCTHTHTAEPCQQAADKMEHVATEHFWMSGLYWGLTAMELLGRLQDMDTAKILDWVSL